MNAMLWGFNQVCNRDYKTICVSCSNETQQLLVIEIDCAGYSILLSSTLFNDYAVSDDARNSLSTLGFSDFEQSLLILNFGGEGASLRSKRPPASVKKRAFHLINYINIQQNRGNS